MAARREVKNCIANLLSHNPGRWPSTDLWADVSHGEELIRPAHGVHARLIIIAVDK